MVLVKILGGIDVLAAVAFLMLIFGITPLLQFILFCSGLLFLKGLFIITGDVLSIIDIFASLMLIISIFIMPISILLWTPALLLLAKGLVSFL